MMSFLHVLISTAMSLVLLPMGSETLSQSHHAFGPLREAFGDQFPQMDVFDGEFKDTPSPEQLPLSSMFKDVNVMGNKENTDTSTEVDITSEAPTTSQNTSDPLEAQNAAFNLDTFTFNRNNTRKINDIFSVLSDVGNDNFVKSEEADEHLQDNVIPSQDEGEPSGDSANGFTQKILVAVKNIENVLSTMSVMQGLYQSKRESLRPDNSSATKEAFASILDLLLDVPTLEGVRTAGLTARSEQEFLDHLSSVLVGAETRSSALTLDPVTVIALLTLAAYLIRAVYQILSVTGRSLDVADGNLNLALSDLPDAMVRIHNWLSSSSVDLNRDDRVTRDIKEEITVPGDVAAVVKLHREGHSSCVRQFLCQEVQHRPLKSLSLSDIIIGGISSYYGEPNVSKHIDGAVLGDRNGVCITTSGPSSRSCSPDTLNEAFTLKRIFTNAAEKVLGLISVYSDWL